MPEEKETKIIYCPSCGKENVLPIGVGVRVKCSECGDEWYCSGIDVSDKAKETKKIYDYFEKQRRKEMETRERRD